MRAAVVAIVCLGATARAQPAPRAADSKPLPPAAVRPKVQAEDVDIAKAHFNTGEAYYQHGRFVDAAHEFEEAYRLSAKAPLLYNVGKSYDGASDFARALDAYKRFLDAAGPDNPDVDFSAQRVERLQKLVGRVTLAGAVPGSAVALDGQPLGKTPLPGALVLNPGRHALELSHDGYARFRTSVDVPVGGDTTVTARQLEDVKVVRVGAPAAAEKPLYKRWWLWTAVGGAVVVAGVITAVVLTSGSDNGPPTAQLPEVH
jgi:tetratricopeptide (TPR) repeat protein